MPKPAVASTILCTVDVVLLMLLDGALHVLLHQRDREPFKGALALPGGYVHPNDDPSAWHAAARVLHDKTGVTAPYLEQLATFSGPERDPRGWSVSIAYYALVPASIVPNDRPHIVMRPVEQLPSLPFDHRRIIEAAVARVRIKSQYSSLPVYLCDEHFTLPQLQAVYEAVLGEPINKVSFRRKLDALGMLEPIAGAMTRGDAHRPAQLYRLRKEFRRTLSTVDRGLNPRS